MVSESISQIHEMVQCLHERLLAAQANIVMIKTTMEPWTLTPLFDRKDGKEDALLRLDDRVERLKKR